MKHFLLFLFIMLALSAAAGDRLNVLLIISDDCRAIQGCYGGPALTPNIDRLANNGLRFDHAYCQYPLCNPSRASFLTGLRPETTKVHENKTSFRKQLPDAITLPQLFKDNGYFVARIGKIFHYNVPSQIGTDGMDDPRSWEQVINPRGRDCDDEDKIYCILAGDKARIAVGFHTYGAKLTWLAADGDDAEQTDGKIALATCKLLQTHHDQPFFIGIGFFRPHTPYVSPKKYFGLYPIENVLPPDSPPDDRSSKPPTALTVFPPNYGMDVDMQRMVRQAYYASVSFMDAQVGVILSELDRLKLRDKTVVVFISDHGYQLGEHGLWQKMTLFEEATRVPMIISAPGMKARGKSTTRLAELVDLYPTLADLCGLPIPKTCEGVSVKPLLDNPNLPWKKAAFTEVMHNRGGGRNDDPVDHESDNTNNRQSKGRSVRSERYRYTEWNNGRDGVELYDEVLDPHEYHNLTDQPEASSILESMKRLLHDGWQEARP